MLMLAKTALQRSGGGAAAIGHSNLTFRGAPTSSADLATYTFASQAIGTAAADRWVIVGVYTVNSSLPVAGPGGIVIGGIDATLQVGNGSNGVQMWAALVPTGTTANIVVNVSSNGNGCGIGVWTVNMPSGLQFASGENAAAGNIVTLSGVSIPANGFAVEMTWINETVDRAHSIDASFTEQAEAFISTGANAAFSHREVVGGAVSGVAVTNTWAAADSVVGACFVSWA